MDNDKIFNKAVVCIRAMLEMLKESDKENERLLEENEQLKEEVEKQLSLVRYWKAGYDGLRFGGDGTPPGGTPRVMGYVEGESK